MSALQFLISAALTKNLSSIMARRRLWPCGGNGCPNGTSVLIYNFCGFGDNIGARARPVGGGGMGWGGIDIFPDVMDGLDSIRNSHRWPRTYVLLAGAPLKSDNLLGRRFTLN